ncbi:MAG: hypothetical protein K0R63_1254 [Rickettsiales bacterium]|jgi:hypothetical protein|nr:hypothetical protein [Rickettsiales bacterium]
MSKKRPTPRIEELAPLCIAFHESEREIVFSLRELLGQGLRGYIDVIMLPLGPSNQAKALSSETLHQIKQCKIMLFVLSPDSVRNQAVHFLAGAAWGKIETTLCFLHSGLKKEQLPPSFLPFPAIHMNDFSSFNDGLKRIAEALGKPIPRVNASPFIQRVINHERNHVFWRECNRIFRTIYEADRNAIDRLKTSKQVSIRVKESDSARLQDWIPFLQSENLLTVKPTGYVALEKEGIFYAHELIPMKGLYTILSDSHLNIKGTSLSNDEERYL